MAGYLGSEQARIDAWNRRPIEDELRAKLARVEQIISSLKKDRYRIPAMDAVNQSVIKMLESALKGDQ